MYCNALHALCNTCSKLDGFHICLTGTYSAFQFTHYHYFYFSPLSSALSFYHSHISPALTPSYVLSFDLTSEFFKILSHQPVNCTTKGSLREWKSDWTNTVSLTINRLLMKVIHRWITQQTQAVQTSNNNKSNLPSKHSSGLNMLTLPMQICIDFHLDDKQMKQLACHRRRLNKFMFLHLG